MTISDRMTLDSTHTRLSHVLRSATLVSRSAAQPSQSTDSSGSLCVEIDSGNIVISKRTLIAALTICVLLALISMAAVAALLYREWARRREAQAAQRWGRKSHFDKRISEMRKEVDDGYSRQYKGCLAHEPENPEMGSDSPVELMLPERCWEVPAIPARAAAEDTDKDKRKSKAMSLFFDSGVGMWLPKK
jgi:hypothetical protein